jgi:hypothetical protein
VTAKQIGAVDDAEPSPEMLAHQDRLGVAKAVDLSEGLVLAGAASDWDRSIGLIGQSDHASLCWAGVLTDIARNHDWDIEARFFSMR